MNRKETWRCVGMVSICGLVVLGISAPLLASGYDYEWLGYTSGGGARGWRLNDPIGTGGWGYSHEWAKTGPDEYLRIRVFGPPSGNTYGAEAWIMSKNNFNDGQMHYVHLTWEGVPTIEGHEDNYLIQITDGFIPPAADYHWAVRRPPLPPITPEHMAGTADLFIESRPSGFSQTTWTIIIRPEGVARLYKTLLRPEDGDPGTPNNEVALNSLKPWYIRIMVTDGTSAGFGAGDTSLRIHGFGTVRPMRPFLLYIRESEGGVVMWYPAGYFYECRTPVRLHAKANPGFVFFRWSGDVDSTENPIEVSSPNRQMCRVKPEFLPMREVWFVDDDANADPSPSDAAVSDPAEDGSPEHPFDSIQEAIRVAQEGSKVVVCSGTYFENLDFLGKNIEVTSANPEDGDKMAFAVINADGTGTAVRFVGGETRLAKLEGFTITGGMAGLSGAVLCQDSHPTISNCLIVGNRAMGSDGGTVYCTRSHAVFENCSVADNYGGTNGAGLHVVGGAIKITNSILWGNLPGDLVASEPSAVEMCYSNVTDAVAGVGNISCLPDFVLPGYWAERTDPNMPAEPNDPDAIWIGGDYHLMSETGRWDPLTLRWAMDFITSWCIDAGDPNSPVGDEPLPNGNRINLGTYGGTWQASRSPVADPGAK